MSILEIQKRYNDTLARADKAHRWMEAPTTTKEMVEKWLPEYNKIVINLSNMLDAMEELLERRLTKKEILEGFKE